MGQTAASPHRSPPLQRQGARLLRRADPFWSLVSLSRRLQAPGGCRWDRAQTISSLLPHLIEETWETFESVKSRRYRELEGELGDVLYTALFLILIAERGGWCDLTRLLRQTREKMIRRHRHVFATGTARTREAAYESWQASKRSEGPARHSPSDAFREQLVSDWNRRYAILHRRRPISARGHRRRSHPSG